MTKYFIEEKKDEGLETERWEKKSEELDLSTAKTKAIKPKERVHICFHDDKNIKPCEVM